MFSVFSVKGLLTSVSIRSTERNSKTLLTFQIKASFYLFISQILQTEIQTTGMAPIIS